MASRFWVGGTATWDNSTTTHWSATSGGVGGQSVPGSADTVTFDASSGGGVITLNYSPSVVSITGGAHTGEFNTGNNNITVQTFSYTGTGARTLTLGSSTITVTGSGTTVITFATITSLTMTANTATFDCTYSGATGTRVITMGAFAETTSPSLKVSAGTDAITMTTGKTVKDLNFTGKGAGNISNGAFTIYGNITIVSAATYTAGASAWTLGATSGTQIITSNTNTMDFPVTLNGVGGTFQLADDLTMGVTRALTLTNGTLDTNSKALSVGFFVSYNSNVRRLILGSSTITITAGNTGTSIINFSLTNLTLDANTATFDCAYSGSSATRNINLGAITETSSFNIKVSAGSDSVNIITNSRTKNLDFTGFSGTITNTSFTVYGDFIIPSGITITDGAGVTTIGATSGTKTLTLGSTFRSVTINGTGGTFQLGGDSTISTTRTLTLTSGILTCVNGASNYVLSAGLISVASSANATLTLGSATHLITGTGTVWSFGANGVLSANTSTIKITDSATATGCTFAGGGKTTYNNLWFARGTSTQTNTITGTNTFADIKDDGTEAHTLVFPNVTTTITSLTMGGGSAGKLLSLTRTGASGNWTLSDTTGTNTVSYVNISNGIASGGATFDASNGTNTNGGGNTGWLFPVTYQGDFFHFI
jgi:hypothetical protein